jgi:hypothetical protein
VGSYLCPETVLVRYIGFELLTPSDGVLKGLLGLLQIPLSGLEIADEARIVGPSSLRISLGDGCMDMGSEGVERSSLCI